MTIDTILVLGAGYSGKAVLDLARERGLRTRAVVRRQERAAELTDHDVVVAPVFDRSVAALATPTTHVVIAFPPDATTDAQLELCAGAITYLSSTGVYGDHRGVVDDATPVTTRPSPTAARRLEAEQIWRGRGATILRCPAIYGPDRGLHVRIARGEHRIPGDGKSFLSRIHIEDLAAFVLAAPSAPGETFVVGDLTPLRHIDLVTRICEELALPLPPSQPIEQVHETLRADRQVNSARARSVLGVTLRHPTYEVPRTRPERS